MATLAVAIFSAGARADTVLAASPQSGSTNTAEPTRNACGRPDISARLTEGSPLELSPIDQVLRGHYGSATVAVTLAPDGRMLKAAILRGTGNSRLDESVLRSIRQSKFTPEQRNCGNVGGTYQVDADFMTDTE